MLYLAKCMPAFDYNYFEDHAIVKGGKPLLSGDVSLEVVFDYQGEKPGGPAAITLKVNGATMVQGKRRHPSQAASAPTPSALVRTADSLSLSTNSPDFSNLILGDE